MILKELEIPLNFLRRAVAIKNIILKSNMVLEEKNDYKEDIILVTINTS